MVILEQGSPRRGVHSAIRAQISRSGRGDVAISVRVSPQCGGSPFLPEKMGTEGRREVTRSAPGKPPRRRGGRAPAPHGQEGRPRSQSGAHPAGPNLGASRSCCLPESPRSIPSVPRTPPPVGTGPSRRGFSPARPLVPRGPYRPVRCNACSDEALPGNGDGVAQEEAALQGGRGGSRGQGKNRPQPRGPSRSWLSKTFQLACEGVCLPERSGGRRVPAPMGLMRGR